MAMNTRFGVVLLPEPEDSKPLQSLLCRDKTMNTQLYSTVYYGEVKVDREEDQYHATKLEELPRVVYTTLLAMERAEELNLTK